MLERLRRTYREIAASPPGERFHRYHQRRKGRHGPWRSAAYIAAGVVLIAVGFVLSLPPLMPGFLLWVPGLALIASQFDLVARALDRGECLARTLYRRLADQGESG